MMTGHLSDEQITELLLGSSTAEVSAHLQDCAQCRGEARLISESIDSFNGQTLGWAEAQSRRRPMAGISRGKRWLSWQTAPTWAMSAVVVVGGVIGTALHLRGPRAALAPAGPVGVATAEGSPETIAEDNRLLLAIDRELSWHEPMPADLRDDLPDGRRLHRRPAAGRVVN